MKILKNILQSKYLLKIILCFIILLCLIRINLDNQSKYNLFDEDFILKVIELDKNNEQVVITFKGKEKIICYYENDFPYNIGDIVKVKGKLYKANKNTIPHLFNYQKYLQMKDIYYLIKINDISLIKNSNSIIDRIKNVITKRINTLPKKEYLYAFILGNTTFINDDIKDSFSYNGISYLLVIGSMQVFLIVKILEYFKCKLKIKDKYYLLILISCFFFLFLFMKNSIGILRSIVCYILKKICQFFHIKYHYDNIILLTSIIFLIINPKYLFQTGFLYSFIISYGISCYNKIIKGSYIKRKFLISIIAFLLACPITVYNNYQINFLSIFLSFIFSFIFPFVLYPLTILTFVFPFLGYIYNIVISIIENISLLFSNISIFNITIPKPHIIFIIIYYIIVLYKPSKKIFIYSLIIIYIFKISYNLFLSNFVIYLDVNQGDSCIIKNKNHVILIDTGGGYREYYQNTIKYLHSIGINKINYLIISHGDYDHMGEAINLVNNFNIEKVIFNCGPYNDLESELIKVLDKKKIKYYSCIKELNIDKNKLYFLQTKHYNNENDNSNVIYTEFDGYKFMFMGDASISTEHEILNKYNLSDIDVLKVGHHGSKTSSSKEFISEINPEYSIISVGKNNRYGHPNKEVLDNLNDSKIYRTDEDGSIMFKIRNNKLKIETCTP